MSARRCWTCSPTTGGKVIDTADVYTNGTSETIVGDLLKGRRGRFVLATKFTNQTDPGDPNSAGNHRKKIVTSIEASLRRLQTDHMVVRRSAAEAKLELSAHVLRHTFVTNLIRSGADVVLVAEITGHRRLDTTRRYSLPSQADKDAAVEAVLVEI